jgi:hypothetical protein
MLFTVSIIFIYTSRVFLVYIRYSCHSIVFKSIIQDKIYILYTVGVRAWYIFDINIYLNSSIPSYIKIKPRMFFLIYYIHEDPEKYFVCPKIRNIIFISSFHRMDCQEVHDQNSIRFCDLVEIQSCLANWYVFVSIVFSMALSL